jgi:predicted pyridoxine 5'-phosphate oxidase superfamily flavin-nucleotide-binding protein
VNGLRDALVGGDPIAREGGLSSADADRMRRVIVAAAGTERETAIWPRPMFVAATLAATLLVGIAGGSRLPRREAARHPITTANSTDAAPSQQIAERRQLQFATPGGTRIIWVFDPAFNP